MSTLAAKVMEPIVSATSAYFVNQILYVFNFRAVSVTSRKFPKETSSRLTCRHAQHTHKVPLRPIRVLNLILAGGTVQLNSMTVYHSWTHTAGKVPCCQWHEGLPPHEDESWHRACRKSTHSDPALNGSTTHA